MRFVGLGLSVPLAFALAACGNNPFAANGESNKAATATSAPAAAPAAAGAATTAGAAAATSGGKGAADPAAVAAAPAPAPAGGKAAGAVVASSTPSGAAPASGRCSDSQNRHVVVVNDSGTTVRELYGSNVDRTSWEEDVLGSDVLGAGNRVDVNWDDGTCMCMFDFRAVLTDGSERTQRQFNVCTQVEWHVPG